MSEQEINHDHGRLAKELLGFTAVDIADNPEMVAQKLGELFAGIKAFVTAVTGDDETALESAGEQMRDLQATLKKHGLTTNDHMVGLPDKIHATYHEDQTRQRQEMAAGLEELAQEITWAADAFSQHLRSQAECYSQQVTESKRMPNESA